MDRPSLVDAPYQEVESASQPLPTTESIKTWRTLLQVQAQIMPQLARVFAQDFDISVSEFDVLVNIAPGESLRHRELAERVILSRSALSRLIDRLVARGFVTRRDVAGDSRGVLIKLTDPGARVRAEALVQHDQIITQAFEPLSDAECTLLTTQLRALLPARHSD